MRALVQQQEKAKSAPKDGDKVALSGILVDDKYHSRSAFNRNIIGKYETVYRNELKTDIQQSRMPPLEVAYINDVYVLFDGFHRYRAMKNCSMEYAMVNVHYGMDYKELPYAASRFNLGHGLPMSRKDVRKIVFKAYIRSKSNREKKRYKSYREIAEDFHNCYAHNTIRNWMKADFPAVFKAMSKFDEDEALIEFVPLDPDEENGLAAIEDLDRFNNRYQAITCDHVRLDLASKLKEQLDDALEGLPEEVTYEAESFGNGGRYVLPDNEILDF